MPQLSGAQMGEMVVDAFRTLSRIDIPGTSPKGFRSMSDVMARHGISMSGNEETDETRPTVRMRYRPSPREISRMELVIDVISRLVKDERERSILQIWATAQAFRLPMARAYAEAGLPKAEFDRIRLTAIMKLARKVEVPA